LLAFEIKTIDGFWAVVICDNKSKSTRKINPEIIANWSQDELLEAVKQLPWQLASFETKTPRQKIIFLFQTQDSRDLNCCDSDSRMLQF
jgi:hypothetical protein